MISSASQVNSTDLEVGGVQLALRGAAESARRIDTRAFEFLPSERVRRELVPIVDALIAEAMDALDLTLGRYDKPSELAQPEDSGIFNCMFEEIIEAPSVPDPRQRIADVAFMARWEMDRKRKELAQSQRLDDWGLIAACCSARRRVVKALSGVERVVSEVEGRPSVFAGIYQTELQRALETRRAYLRFVAGLRQAERERARSGVERGLRLAGTGIAGVVGRDIYEDLRVGDRRTLRELQRRLIEWLRGEKDPLEGERLLGDLVSAASLIMDVNRRPVLVEHDARVLEKLLAALAQPATDKGVFFQLLASVRGRDAELDALIEGEADLRPELWLGAARRVLARLEDMRG